MGLFGSILDSASRGLGHSLGSAVGGAVGGAVGKVANQTAENVTTDMKVANEYKFMAVEEQKKINNLPTNCPHCCAPTTGKLICEYCGTKVVE